MNPAHCIELMLELVNSNERKGAAAFGRWLLKYSVHQSRDENGSFCWKWKTTGELMDTSELVNLYINDPLLLEKFPVTPHKSK